MKVWHCETCGKTAASDTPNDDAAPEHLSYRGQDIGNCPGMMELVEDAEQQNEYLRNRSKKSE